MKPNNKSGRFEVLNQATTPVSEVLFYGDIGFNEFGGPLDTKILLAQLATIPAENQVRVRVNSRGGSAAFAINAHTLLSRIGARLTTCNEGIAWSAASLICAAGKCESPNNAIFMYHRASAEFAGNVDDCDQIRAMLEAHDKAICGILATKCGKDEKAVMKMMTAQNGTWMTGAEAKDYGFVDTLTDEVAITNSVNFDLSQFGVPERLAVQLNALGQTPKNRTMDKTQILALLKERGVDMPSDATDAQIYAALKEISIVKTIEVAAPPAAPVDTNALVKQIMDQIRAENRAADIERNVENLITMGAITAAEKASTITAAKADPGIVLTLQRNAGFRGIGAPDASLEITAESFDAIDKHIRGPLAFMRDRGPCDGGGRTHKEIVKNAVARDAILTKEWKRLKGAMNFTNTISADLQRTVIMKEVIRQWKRILGPLGKFTMVWKNVNLEGNDTVSVPYFALDSTTPTQWVAATGYTIGNNTYSAKTITVDQRYFIGMGISSQDLRRQPFVNWQQMSTMKIEALAFYVWKDILSVITAANFADTTGLSVADNGSTTKHIKAHASFTTNDLAMIGKTASKRHLPRGQRNLMLNSDYYWQLMQDSAIKNFYALNSDTPSKDGEINRYMGFDIFEAPELPANSWDLGGVAASPMAILAAACPIEPSPEVRSRLNQYDMVVDPDSGMFIETRAWGDPNYDFSNWIFECNWGKAAGVAKNLIPIVEA